MGYRCSALEWSTNALNLIIGGVGVPALCRSMNLRYQGLQGLSHGLKPGCITDQHVGPADKVV